MGMSIDRGMCDCARTREFCRTVGCKADENKWYYITEGRPEDHLRRIVVREGGRLRPISRWLRPERAVAEAYMMNIDGTSGPYTGHTIIEITKVGPFRVRMDGVP